MSVLVGLVLMHLAVVPLAIMFLISFPSGSVLQIASHFALLIFGTTISIWIQTYSEPATPRCTLVTRRARTRARRRRSDTRSTPAA